MEKLSFYIVDVFAERRFAGNPLAVFRNVHALSDSEMQEIAKEVNYSETTFIASDEPREGGYDVRIFTPRVELSFAGHPTLGTAHVIRREILKTPTRLVLLNLKVGQVPVKFGSEKGGSVLWMKHLQPDFGQVYNASTVSRLLSLKRSQIDEGFPIQDVSTGSPTIVVPLKTLSALRQAEVRRKECLKFLETTRAKTILVFSPETHCKDDDLSVRFFADYIGIPEDPATGSANGCLAAYLVRHRYFGADRINIRVGQGYEVGRPSLLLLKAGKVNEGIEVQVGGRVVSIARGWLE
ncbi:MAG: PhzF family phenazine biosynthesis protein [Candidatus Bathyarchaeota archaeon]|nr:PhzF family phenazine biosynthesis protein [Candidatus Bathyarchaeota archaeon]